MPYLRRNSREGALKLRHLVRAHQVAVGRCAVAGGRELVCVGAEGGALARDEVVRGIAAVQEVAAAAGFGRLACVAVSVGTRSFVLVGCGGRRTLVEVFD